MNFAKAAFEAYHRFLEQEDIEERWNTLASPSREAWETVGAVAQQFVDAAGRYGTRCHQLDAEVLALRRKIDRLERELAKSIQVPPEEPGGPELPDPPSLEADQMTPGERAYREWAKDKPHAREWRYLTDGVRECWEMSELVKTEPMRTRAALLKARRFQALCENLPLDKLIAAGTIAVDDWTPEQHEQARRWAREETDTMPKVLFDYFRAMGALG